MLHERTLDFRRALAKQMHERELPELKDGDYESGWNDIKSFDTEVEWARFSSVPARKK